jgi:hypothetical protein
MDSFGILTLLDQPIAPTKSTFFDFPSQYVRNRYIRTSCFKFSILFQPINYSGILFLLSAYLSVNKIVLYKPCYKNIILQLSMWSRLALGSSQPPIQWVPGVKRPEREADQSPATTAEVKKMWIYTSTPPYAFMA